MSVMLSARQTNFWDSSEEPSPRPLYGRCIDEATIYIHSETTPGICKRRLASVPKKDIDLLESVQHRATRMVPGLAKLNYEERLRRIDLPTLAYRRTRGDAIEAYKYLHGKYMQCRQ